ncbi:MAG: hypothetical protein IJT12_06825 [Paludibacteraceae bacterium]|nr:hypothetical protein [Paludibacteraceae bacterium]
MAGLLSFGAMPSRVSAQSTDNDEIGYKAAPDETLQTLAHIAAEDYVFQPGDTVVINKSQTKYLTGENISHWVYYVRHRIAQVGGKRFPNGVRLEGINSWVDVRTGLLLMGAVDKNDTARVKESIDRPLILERLLELDEMDENAKRQIEKMAQQYHMTAMVEAAREQAIRDSLANEQRKREQALLDSIAAVQARLDSIRAAQAAREKFVLDSIAREQALKDSLDAAEAARQQAIKDSLAALRRQFNRVGAGLRVGVASMMQNMKDYPAANGKWQAGFDILADAQYAHYWQSQDKPAYGVLTGLSIGYTRNGVTAQGNREFDIIDEDGEQIHYTVTNADAKEKDGSVVIEIPAMFSMIIQDHYFVNAGPRFSIPVYSHYNQDVSQAHIDAYNVTRNVHVTDELITGKVTEEMLKQGGGTQLSRLNIQLSVEGGYELTLPIGHIIGIGAYANYSVFSLYPNDPTGKELISIGEPTSAAPAPVSVTSSTEAYVKKNGLGFFDCGIKVVYHFMTW